MLTTLLETMGQSVRNLVDQFAGTCPKCGTLDLTEDKQMSCKFVIWYDCLLCSHSFEVRREEPLFD